MSGMADLLTVALTGLLPTNSAKTTLVYPGVVRLMSEQDKTPATFRHTQCCPPSFNRKIVSINIRPQSITCNRLLKINDLQVDSTVVNT